MTYVAPGIVKQQIERLLVRHPELAEDEDFRRDVIEGETDFDKATERLIREYKAVKSEVRGLKEFASEVADRAARKEERQNAIRATLTDLLNCSGLPKFKCIGGTISLAPTPRRVVITDEPAIPTAFIRVKSEPNLTAIKEAIEEGASIPGASLSNGGISLRIA